MESYLEKADAHLRTAAAESEMVAYIPLASRVALAQAAATIALAQETRALVEAQHAANNLAALRLGPASLDDSNAATAKTETSRRRIERGNLLRARVREWLGLP